ncbi:MAG: DUF4189 domain-containing protein [Pseudomonadota bacterium]
MKPILLMTALVMSVISVGSAQASEDFQSGVVTPNQPIGEASGTDADGGGDHPKTSDKLIYGAIGFKKDPFFVSFTRKPLSSKEAAVEVTWNDCKKNRVECDEVIWFQYGCSAAAMTPWASHYGVSVKATPSEARQDALKQCEDQGGKGCKLREIFCAPEELNK